MKRRALVVKSFVTLLSVLCVTLGPIPAEAVDGIDIVNRKILRVCSDPANLPFSNEKGEGFENKIADVIADELKVPVEYTWFPMATGFVRMTLFSKRCCSATQTTAKRPSVSGAITGVRWLKAVTWLTNVSLPSVLSLCQV